MRKSATFAALAFLLMSILVSGCFVQTHANEVHYVAAISADSPPESFINWTEVAASQRPQEISDLLTTVDGQTKEGREQSRQSLKVSERKSGELQEFLLQEWGRQTGEYARVEPSFPIWFQGHFYDVILYTAR